MMPVNIVEKFRHRTDKMTARETFPESGRVVERFAPGRADKLRQHEYLRDDHGPWPGLQSGCRTGNGKTLSSSQAQLGQATYLAVA